MALYKYNTSGVFSEIKEKPFKLERDIQRMFETNMSEIMGLEMIKSEFTIKDRRIDIRLPLILNRRLLLSLNIKGKETLVS